MIELSFAKLLLLAVVALIVLGPEKLPGAARTAGALLRRVRSGWDSVRAEVARELEVEEIRRAAREAAARAEAAQSQVDVALREVRTAVARTGAEVVAPAAAHGDDRAPPAAGAADPHAADATDASPSSASPTAPDPTGDLFADAPTAPRQESTHGHA
jgi:sec-independent protein translocase protein TatB